jgi:hypothetical protein
MDMQEILSEKIIQCSSLWNNKAALADEECEILRKKVFGVGDLKECVVRMTRRARQRSDIMGSGTFGNG